MARVLVVDDEKLIVKGIRFSLEQDGYEVDCAYDGEEAIEMAKKTEYDIVLLDVMLPKHDGFEVCQAIREFSDMPVIMLTAKGSDMDKILGLEYGADDYISKPFNILEVKARIRAIIRRSMKAKRQKKEEQGQIPLYYAHKNTGRPLKDGKWFEKFRSNYLDVDNDPLYPFGYGLSYTTFSYSDIDLSHSSMDMNGSLTAAVEVTNTGTWPGSEVVQLYIRDVVGSSTRPVKELKGFQKIFLEPGEMKIVRFKIAPEMLRYYNYDLQLVAEPGDFEVMIGTNSRDVKTAKFTLN